MPYMNRSYSPKFMSGRTGSETSSPAMYRKKKRLTAPSGYSNKSNNSSIRSPYKFNFRYSKGPFENKLY